MGPNKKTSHFCTHGKAVSGRLEKPAVPCRKGGREKPHLLGAVPYYGENHVSTDLLFGNLQMIKNQIIMHFVFGGMV